MAGTTKLGGPENPYVAKFDSSGTLQWAKLLEGPDDTSVFDLKEAQDGNYVLLWLPTAGESYLSLTKFTSQGVLAGSVRLFGEVYGSVGSYKVT